MEFSFTEEQQMIRDTAEAFLAEVSDSAAVRSAMSTELGYDPELWQRVCQELYWPAIHIPESYGGMGLGYVELVATLEQMGRHLFCSPFFSTVCLAANALLVAGNDAQKSHWLPQIIEGRTGTLASTGKSGRWGADGVEGVYEVTPEGYRLNGTWRYVPDGHSAGFLVVAAREQGSAGREGISLFVLDTSSTGVHRTWLPTMDQTRKQAEVVLEDVVVDGGAHLSGGESGADALDRVLQLATIAVAAEQVGVAQQSLDASVSYMQERVQFGRVIASYQALKHKAADMMLKAEAARSAVYYAACVADEAINGGVMAAELPEAASVAKAYCSEAAFFNAGCGIQLHGGVGFTEEYDIQLYFKRAKSSETLLGDAAYHRERVAAQLLDGDLA